MGNLRRTRHVLLATVFVALAYAVKAGPAAALSGPVSTATSATGSDAAAGQSSTLDLAMVAVVTSPAVAGGLLWVSAPRLRRSRNVARFRAELSLIDPVLACRSLLDDDPDRPATTI